MVELKSREAALLNEASKLRVENSRAAVELERFLRDYDALESAFRRGPVPFRDSGYCSLDHWATP
jgi:hypothetical protein